MNRRNQESVTGNEAVKQRMRYAGMSEAQISLELANYQKVRNLESAMGKIEKQIEIDEMNPREKVKIQLKQSLRPGDLVSKKEISDKIQEL